MFDKIPSVPASEELRSFAADIGTWTREKVETAVMNRPENQAILFRGWCAENLEDDASKSWIAELSDPGMEVLVQQVARFLAEFDLQITWLFQQSPPMPAQLADHLRKMIEHYCNACRWGVEAYEEGRRYKRMVHTARLTPRA
jgi:hypothetical protein